MDSVKKGPDRTILPAYPAILRTCGTVYTCGAPTAEGAEADRNYLANPETAGNVCLCACLSRFSIQRMHSYSRVTRRRYRSVISVTQIRHPGFSYESTGTNGNLVTSFVSRFAKKKRKTKNSSQQCVLMLSSNVKSFYRQSHVLLIYHEMEC